jgi:hypothetical protein
MDRGFVNKVSTVKIGDKIRLIHAADSNLGIKPKEIGTVVDTSMSKVVDLEGLRLIMWIRWESGKETAIVDGMDLFEIL